MDFNIHLCQWLRKKDDIYLVSLWENENGENISWLPYIQSRESYHIFAVNEPENWIEAYNDMVFFQLFRLKKVTFYKLLNVVLANDTYRIIQKRYRGGNKPLSPEKALLIFLWYMGKQDTLNSIAEKFRVVPSTVMNIINVLLYIVVGLKSRYISWPKTPEEFQQISQEFIHYPGVIGAVDGTHVNIKVPINQHDSYADRHLNHSINIMAICTSRKIFTYVFIGFPGSAHDSRVFSNSLLVRNIERYGKKKYFPDDAYHLIGDSAFPLQTWLMTHYRNPGTRIERHHNHCLSSQRVCIEHCFGILKGRWRRLHYINTNSVSKAIEIATAASILHNFCYINSDDWEAQLSPVDDNANVVK